MMRAMINSYGQLMVVAVENVYIFEEYTNPIICLKTSEGSFKTEKINLTTAKTLLKKMLESGFIDLSGYQVKR